MSQLQPQPDYDLDFDLDDVDPDPYSNASTYQQAHTQVLLMIGSTPDLSAEERALYIMDLVRYSAWQANGLMPMLKGIVGHFDSSHVQVAMESFGEPEEWKARREEWLGFAKESLGVEVSERVILAEDKDTEMTTAEKLAEKATEKPSEKVTPGKSPAKRRRVDGGEEAMEDEEAIEFEDDEEDEDYEETGRIT
ncbi:hypothetical protein QBC32DRAFT_224105 [Pseudoneurospora amorphoporcata]|uniref:Uncharacterized protein n=1 Tax=Pseudoneurospora amorphoporcata TaxID=241081 RepID=A0AAN6SBF1_9PEZI|nr:hypothetical protein QBC32DRAFT_224105 [Pseudoneurospora amorphoporcata]